MWDGLLPLLLFPVLLGAGLLVPGWLLGRALGRDAGPVGAFLGSSILLLHLILLLDAIGQPITAASMAVGLAGLCAGLAAVARCRSPAPRPPGNTPAPPASDRGPLLAIGGPILIGAMAVMLRAGLDPLSGWDVHFRWDFLARQIIRTGTLGFYPAVNANDFIAYAWCDGIAPLISSLYVWSYLSLGRMVDWATTPVVLGQALLILTLVWRIAALRAGRLAAAIACALLATSPVFLWGISMGQETGFTTLSLLAMFFFLLRHHAEPSTGWLLWAGLASGSGALAREYGLIYPILGLVMLAWHRASWRDALVFALTAMATAAPWYARNWATTGHPLYCHDLGPFFPTNPVYLEYNHWVDVTHRIGKDPETTLSQLARLFVWCGGLPAVLGLAAGLRRWRDHLPALVAMAAIAGLWLWSIHLTSGGYLYSLRVLTPLIALGAIMGGGWLASTGRRLRWVLPAGLALLALDAGARSWYLPIDDTPPWWKNHPLVWQDFGTHRDRWRTSRYWPEIARAADGRKVLVSDPSFHAFLTENDVKAVSLFSPEVHFLFVQDAGFTEQVERLKAAGYRFVLISRLNDIQDAMLAGSAFFNELPHDRQPVMSTRLFQLFDLYPASAYGP